MSDPRWPGFFERLHARPGFRELWESGDVLREATTTKTVTSELVGTVTYRCLTLIVKENRRLKVSVFRPAEASDAAKVRRLDELARADDDGTELLAVG
ncbi:hypothetical protein GCM10027268_15460 [Brachybacterium huguangmaarense]